MLKKFFINLFPICFFINCSEGMYANSWVNVKYESADYPMHKDIAELVAKTRYQGNPRAQDNTSLIGITAYTGEGKSSFAHFGVLSSKLDVDNSKAFWLLEKDKKIQIVSIPDMLRGEPMRAAYGSGNELSRAHKLKAFFRI